MSDETRTVQDDVRAALNQQKEADAAKEAEAVKQEKPEDTEADKKERLRDEKGKFAKGEEKPKGEDKEKPQELEADAEPKQPIEGEPKTEEQKTEKVKAPQSLKAHMKLKWSELPPEWQQEVERIDKAGAEGYQKVQEKVKYADEISNEIRPYEGLIRAEGGSHAGAVRDLLRTAALFRMGTPQQKQQALLQIAQQFSIPLPQMSQPGQDGAEEVPPYVQNLQQQIQQYGSVVQQLQNSLYQQHQQQTQAQQAQALKVVNDFLGEADEQGNPKFPLDDSHEDDFNAEVEFTRRKHPEMGARQVLEKAYENLSWKVPEIRQELLKRQEVQKETDRKKREAEELAKKKQASGSLKGSAAPNAGPVQDDSVRGIVSSLVKGTGARI